MRAARPTALLANTVEGFLVVDRTGRFTYASPAAEKILGSPAKELALHWHDWKTATVDGAPLPVEELPVLRVMRTGEPTAHAKHTFERPDGTTAIVSHDATLLRNDAGVVEGAVASLVDITEREHAAERAKRVEASFRDFAERSPEGVLMHRDGRAFYANPAAARILGYDSPAELVGRSVFDFVHPEDMDVVRERVRALTQDDVAVPMIGERFLHRDGHSLDVEVSAFPVVYEGQDLIMAMFIDVTQLKRTLQDLERSVSVLRATLESTADGILVVDDRGRITAFNTTFVEMWRLPKEIVEARDDARALAFVLDQVTDPAAFAARTQALYAEPETASHDVVHLRNGRTYERFSLPQRIEGRSVGRVWSFRDVTGSKRAQAERDRLLEELAKKHELLIEFDLLKDQFIRVAAHELKTPVAIMKGYADLLLRSPEKLPPGLAGGLEAIGRGAKRIDRIVRGLLDVSQLQLGTMPIHREKVELSELVDTATRRHAMEMTKHRIVITDTQPVIVQADRVRLEQVLETLLDNATRYSPRGGDIQVSLTIRDESAVVCVTDNGVGIPSGKQARIFERFYRAHTDTPHDYGGLGVGLYISREIIAQHGGAMWFTSTEGSGSTFCFSLRV